MKLWPLIRSIRFRILALTVRDLLAVFGAFCLVSFFATLHTFYFVIFALAAVGLVVLGYRLQIAFRETRLRNGWYL